MNSKVATKPKYTIKNDIQHVLDCSDVYIGDTLPSTRKEYVYSDDNDKIIRVNVSVPEALVRIFVEVLTNAVDNVERSKDSQPCKSIKVDVDLKTGKTSVWNDGETIPILKNKDNGGDNSELNNLYIHSLIFGHLRSSSNYDNEEPRELSGKNGVGVKCTNIFSSYFFVNGVDVERSLDLVQEWTHNMTETTGPKIKTTNEKCGFTEIKYIPDFKRFNLTTYPKEIYSIFKKLVVDVSALLPDVNIWFCGQKLTVKNLSAYSKLYYDDDETMNSLIIKYKGSDVVLIGSEISHPPISFVNGQITKDGGQHVQSWSKTIFTNLLDTLNNKKDLKLTKADITPYFQFFIHSRVTKPKFDGQNKNVLKNPKVESALEKSNLNKILKWTVISTIKNKVLRLKELSALKKIETSNKKKVKVDGYDRANHLGVDSVLIVCEGLSAKSYAVSGIQTGIFGKKGRDRFGILPLRGKFLNVKNVSTTRITENKIVVDFIKVLNLKVGMDYSQPQHYKTLNYGTLLILTDADKDGIHIKGLILNFLHELFPTLFKREGFIVSIETPIVKVFKKKGGEDLLFYDEITFENYRQNNPNVEYKYYKGLGTINSRDVSAFFNKKVVKYNCDDNSDVSINKVFKTENANNRKIWLSSFDPKISNYCLDNCLSEEVKLTTKLINVNISDFIEHEMIKFSYEDCKRSLASCIDGMKESQRKVIYAIRKKFKNLKNHDFIKVAQLSGYVAEQTDYKHGEQNLCETIIKLAQDFVGSNNIPLLEPDGQFGTRLEGGKDAAVSRYINTKPHKILKYLIKEEDDAILNYTDEGEPDLFVPILPLVLINGSIGIGTGWSCFIPQYNPMDLFNHIYNKLNGDSRECNIDPYYKNFKGKIKPFNKEKTKYITYGKMKHLSEHKIQVTELPIGMWTEKFKDYCDLLDQKGLISPEIENNSTVYDVNFVLKNVKDVSSIKLTSTLHTTNMVLFNQKNVITKYDTIDSIFEHYYKTRLHYYKLRKDHMLMKLENSIDINENKLNFILKVINDEKFLKQDETKLINILEKENFLKFKNTFNYLLNIPIRNCTIDAIKTLKGTIATLKEELLTLKNITINQMWIKELDELRPYLSEFKLQKK